jgi:hypothetical protein
MQTQLTEAHAVLQAAVETERRAAHAGADRDAQRSRADALADRVRILQPALARAEYAADQAGARAVDQLSI